MGTAGIPAVFGLFVEVYSAESGADEEEPRYFAARSASAECQTNRTSMTHTSPSLFASVKGSRRKAHVPGIIESRFEEHTSHAG